MPDIKACCIEAVAALRPKARSRVARFRIFRNLAVTLAAAFMILAGSATADTIGFADARDRIARLPFDGGGSEQGGKLALEGAAFDGRGLSGGALRFGSGSAASLQLEKRLSTRAGTIAFWVKPDGGTAGSQTYLTGRWAGPKGSYLAVSAGWWEPTGADRLYFILSNQQQIHCSAKYRPVPGKWSFITATWASGERGYCRLFVNGERVAEFQGSFSGAEASEGPLALGSDAAATDHRNRFFAGALDELTLLGRAVSDREVHDAYEAGRAAPAGAEAVAGGWVEEALADQGSPAALAAPGSEARMIFHENIDWALSRAKADAIIAKVKAAGFNVFMPCVWYGPGARFPSAVAPMDRRLIDRVSDEFDPLAYLVEQAHNAGIEVHACITVALRGSTLFPEFAPAGTPTNAYDIHDPAFRRFIVELATEVVQRYPVDGINLDYIRSMGICTSARCEADYRSRFDRSLALDVAKTRMPGVRVESIEQWNYEAVTDVVKQVAARLHDIRPDILLSVDAHPLDPAMMLQGQDSVRWAQEGLIDLVVDMRYNRVLDRATMDRVYEAIGTPNRLAIMLADYDKIGDEIVARDPALLVKYVELVRAKWPGAGIGMYNLQNLSPGQSDAFRSGVFRQDVRPNFGQPAQ